AKVRNAINVARKSDRLAVVIRPMLRKVGTLFDDVAAALRKLPESVSKPLVTVRHEIDEFVEARPRPAGGPKGPSASGGPKQPAGGGPEGSASGGPQQPTSGRSGGSADGGPKRPAGGGPENPAREAPQGPADSRGTGESSSGGKVGP